MHSIGKKKLVAEGTEVSTSSSFLDNLRVPVFGSRKVTPVKASQLCHVWSSCSSNLL